jgi:predicted nucleic acid-binding protein
MPSFVLDASATLPWCFQDESTAWSDSLLQHIRSTDSAIVPAHWPVEVSNALLSAFRRKRFLLSDVQGFWDDLATLPITIEPPLNSTQSKAVLNLAASCNLTIYDALYLELAMRLGLPLATLDTALRQISPAKGVVLL